MHTPVPAGSWHWSRERDTASPDRPTGIARRDAHRLTRQAGLRALELELALRRAAFPRLAAQWHEWSALSRLPLRGQRRLWTNPHRTSRFSRTHARCRSLRPHARDGHLTLREACLCAWLSVK